jgi:hypothetical protein
MAAVATATALARMTATWLNKSTTAAQRNMRQKGADEAQPVGGAAAAWARGRGLGASNAGALSGGAVWRARTERRCSGEAELLRARHRAPAHNQRHVCVRQQHRPASGEQAHNLGAAHMRQPRAHTFGVKERAYRRAARVEEQCHRKHGHQEHRIVRLELLQVLAQACVDVRHRVRSSEPLRLDQLRPWLSPRQDLAAQRAQLA